jgi:hypothetical protein
VASTPRIVVTVARDVSSPTDVGVVAEESKAPFAKDGGAQPTAPAKLDLRRACLANCIFPIP